MDYKIEAGKVFSAKGSAENRRYKKYVVNDNEFWLVANQLNAADDIYYCCKSGEPGFGGAMLALTLVDGTKINVLGPWHSNSQALFDKTGIDVRDKHLTFGVISTKMAYKDYQTTMLGVLYKDKVRTLGTFDRIKNKAQEMANKLGDVIYYHSQSMGGSCSGSMKPNKEVSSV